MLTIFRITTNKGYQWTTNMAEGITLKEAEDYILHKRVDVGSYPKEDMQIVVKVEKLA